MLTFAALSTALTASPRAAPPRMAFSTWHDAGGSNLNLLPFGLHEALLPGETKQVHLFEARFLQLFTEAEAAPGGNVAAVTTLLEIEESRRQDVGVWARLKCVGRVRIDNLDKTDYDYFTANTTLVTDRASEPITAEMRTECLAAHAQVRELEAKLAVARREEPSKSGAGAGASDERVEWGHERTAPVGFVESLEASCASTAATWTTAQAQWSSWRLAGSTLPS